MQSLFFNFFYATNPSFFFMLVYVLIKKEKEKENMQHMKSATINRSHQPCLDVTPPGPHHHPEQVSNPGFRRGRQAL